MTVRARGIVALRIRVVSLRSRFRCLLGDWGDIAQKSEEHDVQSVLRGSQLIEPSPRLVISGLLLRMPLIWVLWLSWGFHGFFALIHPEIKGNGYGHRPVWSWSEKKCRWRNWDDLLVGHYILFRLNKRIFQLGT